MIHQDSKKKKKKNFRFKYHKMQVFTFSQPILYFFKKILTILIVQYWSSFMMMNTSILVCGTDLQFADGHRYRSVLSGLLQSSCSFGVNSKNTVSTTMAPFKRLPLIPQYKYNEYIVQTHFYL